MAFLALTLLLLACGDEVELTDGTRIEGKVHDLGDSIRIEKGLGAVTYPKHMVRKIEYRKTANEIYIEKRKKLREEDLQGRLALARWCIASKLLNEGLDEYRAALKLDPDQEEARAALGYTLHLGQWRTEEEINTAKGLVRHEGRWVTPEERDLDVALEQGEELDRKLSIEVRRLMEKTHHKDPEVREKAQRSLAAMEPRYTESAYLKALKSRYPQTLRFAVDELGRLATQDGSRPLARVAIWDNDPAIRAAALTSMVAIKHPDSATFLTPYLRERNGTVRLRVINALSRFPDLRAAGPLVNQLDGVMDTLRIAEEYSQKTTAVVNRVIILNNGSRVVLPKRVQLDTQTFDPKQQARLLDEKLSLISALKAVTGQDFGDAVPAWRAWLRKQK